MTARAERGLTEVSEPKRGRLAGGLVKKSTKPGDSRKVEPGFKVVNTPRRI